MAAKLAQTGPPMPWNGAMGATGIQSPSPMGGAALGKALSKPHRHKKRTAKHASRRQRKHH